MSPKRNPKGDRRVPVLYGFIAKVHNAYEQWQASLKGKFDALIVLLAFTHQELPQPGMVEHLEKNLALVVMKYIVCGIHLF